MGDRGKRAGSGATFETCDCNVIRAGLADTGCDCTHTNFGDQFDGNTRFRIDVLQVVYELRYVLDRIDVVMRRRTDEFNARR